MIEEPTTIERAERGGSSLQRMVRRPMTIHEKHMEYVDKVNNSKTQAEYWHASGELHGFREGLRAAGIAPDLIACDLTQFERGHENRPMCCGVFNDWSPNTGAEAQPPANQKG